MKEIKIIAFTGKKNDPSSRFRIRQYKKILSENNILLNEYTSRVGKYPPSNKLVRPIWLAFVVLERLFQVIYSNFHKTQITFLQREMISSLHTFESCISKPIIFDVDDAIHLRQRTSNSLDKICGNVNAIICGNQYLYNYYKKYEVDTYIIPTAIDTDIYVPKDIERDYTVIGWIGSSSNFESLYKIQDAMKILLDSYPSVVFRVIADKNPQFSNNLKYQFFSWSMEKEITYIQDFDIGIMPLVESEWSKGKCSFKMLQYMSCGKPVVVSPIGMNVEVFEKGTVGLSPVNYFEDWIGDLEQLINDNVLRKLMGKEGRRVVLENYSIKVCGLMLARVMKEVVRKNQQ